jgi:hypothetical protein
MKVDAHRFGLILAAWVLAMAATQARAACNAASLSGDFWFVGNGSVQRTVGAEVKFAPFAEIGEVHYDGKGSASLVETVALHNGQSEIKATGTYVVSADCRGSIEWNVNGNTYLQSYALVILSGGSEIQTVAFRNAASGGSRPLSSFVQRKL